MKAKHQNERGVYLVFFALSVFFLFGFVALAIDVARQMSVHNELQNASDACAISAVSELNGSSDSTGRATLAGIFVANQNLQNFQNGSVVVESKDISYATSVSGPFVDATSSPSNSSTFVKCSVSSSGFIHFFAAVLGVPNTVLSASSIATLLPSSSVLSLPFAINKGQGVGSLGYSAGDNISFSWDNVGTVTATVSSSTLTVTSNTTIIGVNSLISGNGLPSGTKVVSNGTGVGLGGTYLLNNSATITTSKSFTVTTPSFNSFYFAMESSVTNAANEIQKFGLMNTAVGNNIVITNYTSALTGTGPTLVSFEDAWNSRFGIYRSANAASLSQSTLPDLSGYFSTAPLSNFYSTYNITDAPARQLPSGSFGLYTTYGSNEYQGRGASNRRYLALPVVNGTTVIGWACALAASPEELGSVNAIAMIQYIGPASNFNSPCRSFGLPGNQASLGPLVPTLVQ